MLDLICWRHCAWIMNCLSCPGLGFEECSAASVQMPNEPIALQHVDAQVGG